MIEHFNVENLAEVQRLFHGRGHAYANLSHVNVDWLSPVILITLYQEDDNSWLHKQVEELVALIPQCQSVQVQFRCRQLSPTECFYGENITNTQVAESELKYHIALGKAQNTGLFLDMRNGRDWVTEHAKGMNVLNLFAYTCAFSVAALAGGASQVVNVDLSKSSLSKGRDNHRLNNQDLSKVKFEGVDIFKSYGRLKKYGPYDLLICDPPSFQKGSVDIERDYQKIIKRIPQLVKADGLLMLCLNSPSLNEEFLLEEVARECPDCIFQEQLLPPSVYKEQYKGKGLKVLIFKYQPE